MVWNNFVVTAMGRSGTMFLAHTLDLSPTWSVKHEPPPQNIEVPGDEMFHRIMQRFRMHNYGEVNSHLRWCLHKMSLVNKRAVLLRHPHDILLSAHNKRLTEGRGPVKYGHFSRSLRCLDELIESGVPVFRFEDYTTSVDEIIRLAEHVGITDLPVDQIKLNKVNATPRKWATYDELPKNVQAAGAEAVTWFVSKYFKGN